MSERRETSVKTEYRDGKKIVTTTTVVTVTTDDDRAEALAQRNAGSRDNTTTLSLADLNIKASSSKPKGDFQKEGLERHNHYRAMHGVPALQWCSKCATKAQKHADYLAKTDSFAHSDEKGFGENLYCASSSRGPDVSAVKAVDSWYEEIKDMKRYGEPSPSNFSQVGHFTQVVWKESTHVGMGVATRGNTVYIVANYLPAGNMVGHFHENVLPPRRH